MGRAHKYPDHPGIASRVDRKGEIYWRYRAKGSPEIKLPGAPGDECFEIAYQKAVRGQLAKFEIIDLPGRALLKTFGHAQRRLEATMEWCDYDEKTRAYNTRLIERFLEMPVDASKSALKWRDTPVEFMTADHLRGIVEGIFRTHRTTAKHLLNAVRKLLWIATDVEKWIKPEADPSLSIRVRPPKSVANPAWQLAAREAFEAQHPPGSAARTCYSLALWMGNRRGDVANIGWDDLVVEEIELCSGEIVVIEAFDFRQGKGRNRHGGREMFLPVIDKLASALEPLERTPGATVLRTAYGKAFSEKSLTTAMRKWTEQAGLPAGHTLHGLRRTFGTMIAECGAQARQIMDALGHSSMAVSDSYVRDVNKRRAMVDITRAVNEREERRDQARRRGNLRVVR
ncbi:tyrosine-type recombinase/integrase [Rhizobium mongolense]|uniref:tyrosine-type recombinase/integrase n=1 Tax=Rhizobium TaxID=379 RepID=UPI0024B064A1|nr:site-specific integrase [Rhizobium sp. CC1099]WFU88876.1 site-specific integrase [Rhizobium sp. CC1099]